MSSILEGKLLLIRDSGVLLILRPCETGGCSRSCIWGLLGIIAPLFLEPVCEEIYFANFASLILVCFFCSIGWFCRISIRALLITFFTGWVDVFLAPSLVLMTSFWELFGSASNLFWDVRVLFYATYCRPIIGEGDYFVVIVPPIFFYLLMTRAYFEGEVCWLVLCRPFRLSVCATPNGSCAAWRLLPVCKPWFSFELYLKSIWLPCSDWAFEDSLDFKEPSLNSLGWLP